MTPMEFRGRIGNDWRDSEPWWPPLPTPPEDAPNVVLIVLDDVGFAQLGCYGSDIETPFIDAVAAEGVRLTNFHTTALCSPTRACLLTGRNHHRSGMGRVADLATGFPGYWGRPPRENGFLSEMLRATGYATYAVGKWHLSPEGETNMANSRATWPLGRGFDRWYGFHGGETHQFVPALYHDNHAVRPPRSLDEGYHLSADLADRAIEYLGDLRAVDDELPFFLYFATGACHSPHHAPAEWIERYKGRFAKGWDAWREETFARQLATGIVPEGTVLTPRPPWVPAWDSLGPASARARRALHGVLRRLPVVTPTSRSAGCSPSSRTWGTPTTLLVIIVSDNGASSEGGKEGTINEGRLSNFEGAGVGEMYARLDEIGGPRSHNNYPWGWTMAGNTPFKRWKREVHEGGVADPCIVRASAGRRATEGGGVRRQYAHAIDIAPTVLELVGITPPAEIEGIAQSHLDGTSFAYVLGDGGEKEPDRHLTQHFEMLGSRAIYHDGWKAVTYHPVGPIYDDGLRCQRPVGGRRLGALPCGRGRLGVTRPRRRVPREGRRARRPVVGGGTAQRRAAARQSGARGHGPQARPPAPPDHLPLLPGGSSGSRVGRRRRAKPLPRHELSTVEVPDGVVASGTLLALGCVLGGWSFHVIDGRLRYVHNLHGQRLYEVVADTVLGSGRHEVAFRFEKDEALGGQATLVQDGVVVGTGAVERFTPVAFNEVMIGLTCGYEWGPAVGSDYEAPFPFNGTIVRAEVTATGPVVRDPVAEVAAILASQ